MIKQIEPQHTLYTSVDEMLKPETLGRLLSKPVTRVECRPMNGHSGLAGGQLSYVETDAGRLVLKRMSIASDWIMFASNDQLCRSVMLWQYGLLDRLHPHLEHKIIACSRDASSWAILMHDLSGHVFGLDKPLPPELVPVFLDALAKLHATFWNDPLLKDTRLGLCDPAQLLDQTSLPVAQKNEGKSMGVIPVWVQGGWKVMEDLLDPDVFAWMGKLSNHPQPLLDVLGRFPWTLLHGDYRAENLAYPGNPVAIDWQEATRGLMTIDLAWLTKTLFIRKSMGQEQAVLNYRHNLETYLNRRFDNQEWQKLVDLGHLVDALRSTCFAAYWYKHTDDPNQRDANKLSVRIHNAQVRAAMRWF
jgi:hypothetical protein